MKKTIPNGKYDARDNKEQGPSQDNQKSKDTTENNRSDKAARTGKISLPVAGLISDGTIYGFGKTNFRPDAKHDGGGNNKQNYNIGKAGGGRQKKRQVEENSA